MTKDTKIELRIDSIKKDLFKEVAQSKGKKVSALLEEMINQEILNYLSFKEGN